MIYLICIYKKNNTQQWYPSDLLKIVVVIKLSQHNNLLNYIKLCNKFNVTIDQIQDLHTEFSKVSNI